MIARYDSWGRTVRAAPATVVPFLWRSDPPPLGSIPFSLLAYGAGRSYGDSCLNDGGAIIDMKPLSRLIAFDDAAGILRCEAGMTISEILDVIVPRAWFLPVTPGTKHVTIGGCIANDVHGKNHHRAGTFGCHVRAFELLRSDGERIVCRPTEQPDLFAATIGGLGLTGIITWAELQLRHIASVSIDAETIPIESLEQFFTVSRESDGTHEYTVAWFDSFRPPSRFRAIFFRGNHAAAGARSQKARASVTVPFDIPSSLLCAPLLRLMNAGYAASHGAGRNLSDLDRFFYPLDAVHDWNRLYGRSGLYQYQCVVPSDAAEELLDLFAARGMGSFLAVLKTFGAIRSPGMLSFPRPGVTIALDFPARDRRILSVLDEADRIVAAAGGAVYPAKDAHMSAEHFREFFPRWRELAQLGDPKFSSNFWRRVTGDA